MNSATACSSDDDEPAPAASAQQPAAEIDCFEMGFNGDEFYSLGPTLFLIDWVKNHHE